MALSVIFDTSPSSMSIPSNAEDAAALETRIPPIHDDGSWGKALHAPVINNGPDSESEQDALFTANA